MPKFSDFSMLVQHKFETLKKYVRVDYELQVTTFTWPQDGPKHTLSIHQISTTNRNATK